MILSQDELLATRPEFKVGTWIGRARNLGNTPEEKDLYEWNARVQITTWGNRLAADEGGLRDYAHREWQGLLRYFYRPRWKAWFDARLKAWPAVPLIDFYPMEEAWIGSRRSYTASPEGDAIGVVVATLDELER